MVDRGITSTVLVSQMGHANSGVTERKYVHLFNRVRTDEAVREAMQAAMDMIGDSIPVVRSRLLAGGGPDGRPAFSPFYDGQTSASLRRVSARCSGSTFTSARTGMKFVSPAHRGTRCTCTWSVIPAPAIRPRFQPRLYPWGE
jgi:hypothetical protein